MRWTVSEAGGDSPGQLFFQFINDAGGTTTPDVVFTTDDSTYNQISLSIGLTTGSTKLEPGTIPDPSTPPLAGMTLYLDLSALQLSDAVWQALDVPSTDWKLQKFAAEGVIGLTPAQPLELSSGTSGTLSLPLSGITVPKALATQQVQIYVSYYGVTSVPGTYSTFAIALRNRPDDTSHDLAEAISVSLSPDGIVNSLLPLRVAANAFALRFASTQRVEVVAGPSTQFEVTFVYGAPQDHYGFGALTDITNAKEFELTAGDNASQWTITRNGGAQTISWTLKPPAGSPIVGRGAQSIVGFNFANVVTTYQPGPTAMLVSYSNIDGYADGTFALLVTKVAHAVVNSLTVTPNPTCFSGGSAHVTVGWTTNGATSLELTQNFQSTSVTGQRSVPATLAAQRTTFTLKATGAAGTVENTDYKTVEAIALPVVNSFAGFPTEIYSGSLSHDLLLSWAVDSTDTVTLSSTGGSLSGQTFQPIGSTPISIQQPQMITLAPATAAAPLSLTRRLVISAFTPTAQDYPLTFRVAIVVASPTGPFLVAGGPQTNSLTIIDTVRYAPVGTVALGRGTTAIVFSPDGQTLATTNTDKTISVLGVALGVDGMPVFGAPMTITVPGTPQALVFSPNGPRFFATIDPGEGAGLVASLLCGQDGVWSLEGTVCVGGGPRGLALQGSRLWVANFSNDTVSMVGLLSTGMLGTATPIQGFAGGPTAICATPSGQQLLVACATSGTVRVVDPDHPAIGQSVTLTVGRMPSAIAVAPSGAYAFVTNRGDNTVSLVDCWGLPHCASVLGTALAVGPAPASVSVSPDGLGVHVATESGLTVITLATYRAKPSAPSMPNHATNVAVSPDGAAVFAWHDASLPTAQPNPGILVYAPSSAQTTNLLPAANVTHCVVSPDPLARQAFAIVQDDPRLYAIATDQLETTALALGLPSGTSPVALAITGDGNTVLVVTASARHDLSLVVVREGAKGWVPMQTLGLYCGAPNGRVLLRTTPDGSTVFLVDVAGAFVRLLRRGANGYALLPNKIQGDLAAVDLAVLPDGSTAYVLNAGSQTNTITVVDVASLRAHIAAIPQPYVNLTGLQPSPDGRRLFATDTNASALRVLDPNSFRIVQTIPLAATPTQAAGASGLAVVSDGSRVFTANATGQTLSIVEQIQMGTGTTLQRFAATRLRTAAKAPATADAGPYSGLFMRHFLAETPGAAADGWASSPDVIPYGDAIAPDPTIFTSPAGYQTDYVAQVAMKNPNYVYIRGRNTTNAPLKSRAYFYYARGSLALWPSNWQSSDVTVNTLVQNWVDITAAPNAVAVAPTPLLWVPPSLDPGSDHYCVIAWVDNSADPKPPDLASYSKFVTFDDLVQFVISHHNIAWRNTVDVVKPPPDYSYATALPMGAGGGTVVLNVTFSNVPLDGQFSVNLQGTSPQNSIALSHANLTDYQGGFSPRQGMLTFPGNFNTSLVINHWPGQTPLPDNAKINVTLAVQIAPSLMADIVRMCQLSNMRMPVRKYHGIASVVLGTVTYNLRYGALRHQL